MDIIVSFGKYKGKSINELMKDNDYKNWLIKQSFFKNQYPDLYNAVINYKKPINLLEECEKNLCYDILEKIGEYFKLPENNKNYENCKSRILNPEISPFTWVWNNFNDYDLNHDDRYIPELTKEKNQIINVFNHRKKLYNVLVNDYKDNKFLKNNNFYEYDKYWDYHKLYHTYKKFLTTTINIYDGNKVCYCCNAEQILCYLQENHYKPKRKTIKFMNDFKINFGKYKDKFTFQELYKFSRNEIDYKSENYTTTQRQYGFNNLLIVINGSLEIPIWKIRKYLEWVNENIIEEKPELSMSIYFNVMNEYNTNLRLKSRYYD